MKVLVATKKTQGQKPGDYSDTPEGELVTFGSNSDEYVDETQNKPRSEWKKGTRKSKKYDTAMVGITSGKATTTILVAEVDITEYELARKVSKSLDIRGWRETMREKRFRKWIEQDVRDIIKVANDFSTGAVLEKKKNKFYEREGSAQ